MDFYEVVDKVVDLLRRRGRLTYSSLKIQFQLDDAQIEALREEILYAHESSVQADDRGFLWIGDGDTDSATETPLTPSTPEPTTLPATDQEPEPLSYTPPHLAEKILQSKAALEGERKQVTVLFCDLANSTAIAEKIGAEKMHGLLNSFFELALKEVHRYEGTINQFLGDGFMALYGAPLSLEDHARRGVLAAIALQRSLNDAELGKPYGVECAFRLGLNSGLVVVGSIGDNLRMDYSAIGDVTNLASRLQGIAEPGEILVSEATRRFVEGYVRLKALKPVMVKGKTQPVSISKVIRALPRRSPVVARGERTLSEFVGRERELAVLDELFHQVESGQGQIVGTVAEAGGGKSRLLYEFRQRLQDKRVTYLEGRCLSYGSTIPYHPIIDVLRNNCGITETDSSDGITEKVRLALQEVGMDAEESAPYLLQLLGVNEGTESIAQLTPEAVRSRTFDTLKQMSLKGSQEQPLIFEIEDLHWIDQTSKAYLAFLVESLAGASIMLLTTYRPGYQPAWISKSYATQISLHHLTPQDGLAVVHSVLHGENLPEHMEQIIVEKAEGNPFFLEELTRSIMEQGDLQADTMVPDTIQGVLMARIDRLPEEPKRLLQTASVLGREFSPTVLKAIWKQSEALEPLLQQLKRLEFLFERTGEAETTYIFNNALTQEVAYESLLTTHRQFIHVAAGQALERLYHESLTEHYEELAYHGTRGAVWEKAFDYLLKSGDKARQAYANQEAITFYTQAIDVSKKITPLLDEAQLLPVYEGRGLVWRLLHNIDESIADFRTMLQLARACDNQHKEGEGLCHLSFAHYQKMSGDQIPFAEQYAQEAMELAQQMGNQKILALSLVRLGSVDRDRGNLQEANSKLEQVLHISRREGFNDSLAQSLAFLGSHAYWQGKFFYAVQVCQEGVSLARDVHDGYYELFDLANLCLACWSAGNYAQALRVLKEGMTKAQERKSTFIIGRLTNTLGWFHRELGDMTRAVEYDLESVELGRTSQVFNVEVSALINVGIDHLALGHRDRALSVLEPTLERVDREAFGSHRWRWTIRLLIGLADLSYTTGDDGQALRYVEEGIKEAQATTSQKYVALGWALRGKIVAKRGDTKAAGTDLQRAFSLAEQLQSPSLIYPIAYDLGRWHESSGKAREAAALYGRAKATIDQMATAVEDEVLRSTFLQSALVQEIHERASRLGG